MATAPAGSFAELSSQGQDSTIADRAVELQRALGTVASSLAIATTYLRAGEEVEAETHAAAAREMY